MSNELERSRCLEEVHYITYHASNNLLNSGRYIKALRHTQGLSRSDREKMRYEYLINRCLQKHIVFLQEAIINGYGKTPNTRLIPAESAKRIKALATSSLAVSDGKHSLIDVDGLKKMEMIKRAVLLKDDLVLPCKVKSENQKYKFNTQIIMTRDNVLSYASRGLDYEPTQTYSNKNIAIQKVGAGIKNNELLAKSKNTTVSR